MSARPFIVHVAKLRRVHGTRWREVRVGTIDGLDCTGSSVPDGAQVEADVVLESMSGGVSASGTLKAPWTGQCRRCLAPASGQMQIRVLEHFTVGGDGSDTYPLVDDELDLEPMVHDAVLLELPQAPLCSPDCKGLCPTCGVDRNREACNCEDAHVDHRWAPLQSLVFGDQVTEDATGAN
jgi:uncharacterized protein